MTHSLKPHLVLFVSIDLVQSTTRKFEGFQCKDQVKGEYNNNWYTELIDFYYRFDDLLSREINKFKYENRNTVSEINDIVYPKMWKVLGDELLFYIDVKNEFQIYNLIQCFITAVSNFESSSKTRENSSGFTLKATIWTAILPILNEKVYFNASSGDKRSLVSSDTNYSLFDQYFLMKKSIKNKGNVFIDFVGPSIDAGFRLAEYSDAKKIIISLELALFLSEAIRKINKEKGFEDGEKPIEIQFAGKKALRDAYGNLEYPIFYLEKRQNKSSMFLENIKKFESEKKLQPDQISQYAISYFHEFFPEIFKPFIPDSKNFNLPPKAYIKKLSTMNDTIDNEVERASRMKELKVKIGSDSGQVIEREEIIDFWREILKKTGEQ